MALSDKLTLPAKLESLNTIRKFIREAAVNAGLDDNASYNLQLAVDEIATNTITHGYHEANLSGDLIVHSELTDKLFRITIEDTGLPFDPRTLKLPAEEDLSKPLEERPIGGLGVYLALNGVDRFDYERVDDHNLNIFEVNL